MAHVLTLMPRPVGRAGLMRQPDTVPVVVATWFATEPTVSVTVPGENDTVGLAMSTDKVSVVRSVEPSDYREVDGERLRDLFERRLQRRRPSDAEAA